MALLGSKYNYDYISFFSQSFGERVAVILINVPLIFFISLKNPGKYAIHLYSNANTYYSQFLIFLLLYGDYDLPL